MTSKRERRLKTWTGIGLIVLLILGVFGWLVWRAMLTVPADSARIWALVATLLVPAGIYAGWSLGQMEARGKLAGFDLAIGRFLQAIAKAADLRTTVNRAVRQSSQPPHPHEVVELPKVPLVHRDTGRGDVVEL
jgi:hypothetical protein